MPREIEADYSEALLDFRAGKVDQAQEILAPLLSRYPKVFELLELKALIEKAQDRFEAAKDTYETLLKDAAALRRPLYEYELGTVFFRLKNHLQARRFLESALRSGVNLVGCHLFLGLIDFELRDWESAQLHFREVIRADIAALKPQAAFYLGQIAVHQNRQAEAVSHYIDARQLALEQKQLHTVESVSAFHQQLIEAIELQLRPLQRSTLLLNVGWLLSYDSNQFQSAQNDLWINHSSSVLTTLFWGATYATSPISAVQWVPSLRGSINYNFNRNTRTAQFVNNSFGIVVTKDVLSRSNFGARLAVDSVFQYSINPTTDSGAYHLVDLSSIVGPFFKVAVANQWQVGGNLFFIRTNSTLDNQYTEVERRSGWTERFSFFAARSSVAKVVNPAAALSLEINQASGVNYRSRKVGFDVGNTSFWTDKFLTSLGLGVATTFYPEKTSGARNDESISVLGVASYRLSHAWNLIGNLNYLHNLSNQESFRYNRLQIGFGVTWVG